MDKEDSQAEGLKDASKDREDELLSAYRCMVADTEREKEADEWSENLIQDGKD